MKKKLSLLLVAAVCLSGVPLFATPVEVVKETFLFSSAFPSSTAQAKVISAVYRDGADYLYAYQIFDVTGSEFSWFAVGLQANPFVSNLQVGDLGFLAPSGSVAPMDWALSSGNDSVDALFIPNKIGPGETSQWLTFVSPWEPGTGIAVLANLSGTNKSYTEGSVYIPTIPEPATIALLGAGLLALRRKYQS